MQRWLNQLGSGYVSAANHSRQIQKQHDVVFQQCVSLNTELHKLAPLVRQMHLLSANAVSSAARAGSEGDAFRVLTQDIKLLGDEVSQCIASTQKIINDIVLLASNLARLLATYVSYSELMDKIDQQVTVTDPAMFRRCLTETQASISELNHALGRSIRDLINQLDPLSTMVHKGEYLAVFSSVEAANAGIHGASFEAVSNMLRELVTQLSAQNASQRRLLRDLAEGIEQLQLTERNGIDES